MELYFGQKLDASFGPMQLTLPGGAILIWREARAPEAILAATSADVPAEWLRDQQTSLKVFGDFDLIRKIFPGFRLPPGTKVIAIEGECVVRLDFENRSISYFGKRRKRVAIVDDSSTIRKLLRHVISGFEGWDIVAEVESAEKIPQVLEQFHPDLVTLDLNLPSLNGAQAMKMFLAPKKMPTLLITSQPKDDGGLVMDALNAGALDYLQKPESGKLDILKDELHIKMEGALRSKWITPMARAPRKPVRSSNYNPEDFLIVIGSSTGGTMALQEIFTRLPEVIPPILVTQHIPAGFSKALAERLNGLCPFEIKEAEEGDLVKPGRVLIAPGDHHLQLCQKGRSVKIINSEPINRFRPSIEFMFQSVLRESRKKVIAIMLTGMGKDGATAMVELRKAGAMTIAQDEASSVVFGMPKEVIRLGGADYIKSLTEIPDFLIEYLSSQVKVNKSS